MGNFIEFVDNEIGIWARIDRIRHSVLRECRNFCVFRAGYWLSVVSELNAAPELQIGRRGYGGLHLHSETGYRIFSSGRILLFVIETLQMCSGRRCGGVAEPFARIEGCKPQANSIFEGFGCE